MFKLIFLILAAVVIGGSCAPAPAPVPPLLAPHAFGYPQPYVKYIPIHPAAVPLAYHQPYKWIHPGSVYIY